MSDVAIALGGRWATECAAPSLLPLRVRGLGFSSLSVTILDGVDLDVTAGGCSVIMGHNGAGKSVLLRLLHGMLKPTAGTIRWAADLRDAELRKRQAMVFQHPVLLRRSVAANIRYALKVAGFDRSEQQKRLERVIEENGLVELVHRPARVLSGGERQRVALARALSIEPEILFLDEPTASLDPVSTQAIEDLIRRARDSGTKVVLVTQNIGQARRLGQDVVFLHKGRITEHTPATRFLDAPLSAPGRAFIAGQLDI